MAISRCSTSLPNIKLTILRWQALLETSPELLKGEGEESKALEAEKPAHRPSWEEGRFLTPTGVLDSKSDCYFVTASLALGFLLF